MPLEALGGTSGKEGKICNRQNFSFKRKSRKKLGLSFLQRAISHGRVLLPSPKNEARIRTTSVQQLMRSFFGTDRQIHIYYYFYKKIIILLGKHQKFFIATETAAARPRYIQRLGLSCAQLDLAIFKFCLIMELRQVGALHFIIQTLTELDNFGDFNFDWLIYIIECINVSTILVVVYRRYYFFVSFLGMYISFRPLSYPFRFLIKNPRTLAI